MPCSPLRILQGSGRASPGKRTSMAAQPGTLAGRTLSSVPLRSPGDTPYLPPLTPESSSNGPHRIRSAVHSRSRVKLPSRSAKSAGFTRSGQAPLAPAARPVNSARPLSREPGKVVNVRRRTPAPVLTVDNPGGRGPGGRPWTGEKLEYDEQLKKHGWKMEVPGDPFGLKRPCLSARLPYTESLIGRERPPPQLAKSPSGPRFKRNGWGTYFINTIPKHLASFDIHPEFFSELINARKMELQNRWTAD